MTVLRAGMPELPEHMRDLPIEERGYPVPAFVQWIDGKPDFRIMNTDHYKRCIQKKVCWVCGKPFTNRRMSFVVGPMCAINRTSSEPPSHFACASFSAMACPFLSKPKMVRRENDLPEEAINNSVGGFAIRRNPGVALVWQCRDYTVFKDGMGGVLIEMGEPLSLHWWCEGRPATRAEVMASIETGLPALREMAEKEEPIRAGAIAHLQSLTANVVNTMLPRR